MFDHPLGIPVLDDEHRSIYALNQKLQSALDGKIAISPLDVTGELYALANSHFSHEESLLKDWSGYTRHVELHVELISKLNAIFSKYDSNDIGYTDEDRKANLRELSEFVGSWLNDHMSEDKQFVPYLLGVWKNAADLP